MTSHLKAKLTCELSNLAYIISCTHCGIQYSYKPKVKIGDLHPAQQLGSRWYKPLALPMHMGLHKLIYLHTLTKLIN